VVVPVPAWVSPPVPVTTPDWVTAAELVSVRSVDTIAPVMLKPLFSVTATFAPVRSTSVKALPRSVRAMSLVPALNVAAPVTLTAAVWLMLPAEVNWKVPTSLPSRTVAESSVMVAVPVVATLREPKSAVARASMRMAEPLRPLRVASPTAAMLLPVPAMTMASFVLAPLVPVTVRSAGELIAELFRTQTPTLSVLTPVPPPVPVTFTSPVPPDVI
jgi:hypothetical protein